MTTMTVEDMRAIVAMMREAQGTSTPPEARRAHGNDFKKEMIKHMKEFCGEEEGYADWALKTFMCIDSVEDKITTIMKLTEKEVGELTAKRMAEIADKYTVEEGYMTKKWMKELYDILGIKLQGPAFTILKTVEDGNGFEVWRQLRAEAKPSTAAGTLKAIVNAVVRKRIEDIREVLPTLTEWEVRVQTCVRDHNEGLSARMQIAVATSMCPLALQETISQ